MNIAERPIAADHTVEKIGGTTMTDYASVRDHIVKGYGNSTYNRIIVVSAYGGITDLLLENKKTGEPGVFALFRESPEAVWLAALSSVHQEMRTINASLFVDTLLLERANRFLDARIDETRDCLKSLANVCSHGHFNLSRHLQTVRELLASLGEAHSAWNLTALLARDGVNTQFVDLTGWNDSKQVSLDERLSAVLSGLEIRDCLPIVTGYAHCQSGLMSTFDRGYSEMTFSRLAVLSKSREAVIHKEFHLSSADPRLVGVESAVPIGSTNYDVADQLANLGMEAIHPRAAKGLRQAGIPLRVRNTFDPDHEGTLITSDWVNDRPCVEIVAGCQSVYAIEVFDQDMAGDLAAFDEALLSLISRFKARVITKDTNANTLTHYLDTNLKTVKRILEHIAAEYPEAESRYRRVAIVSAIGSNMKVPGILASTVQAIADADISVLALHQSMRQVDMQFVIDESNYDAAIKALHATLVEVHDHGRAIRLAS